MKYSCKKAFAALLAACALVTTSCAVKEVTSKPAGTKSVTGSLSEPGKDGEPSEAVKNPVEDAALHRDILVNYGADADSGKDGALLEVHKGVSLFQREDWSSEQPLPLTFYYSWNLGQLWNEDISDEERLEKYAHPSGQENVGWFFPQDIYEARATQYFEITVDELRTAPEYDAKNKGYAVGGGGGFGATPKIALYQVESAPDTGGDILKLHLTLVYNEHNQEGGVNEYKILTVRLAGDGSYQYIGYETEKNPPQEQIDAAFQVMPNAADSQLAVYVCEELGFTITFPSNWENNYTVQLNDLYFQEVEGAGRAVEFFYKGDTSVPILNIHAVPINVWEQVKGQMLAEGAQLAQNEDYVFVASPFGRRNPFNSGADKELFDSMYIEKDQVSDKLKFELK